MITNESSTMNRMLIVLYQSLNKKGKKIQIKRIMIDNICTEEAVTKFQNDSCIRSEVSNIGSYDTVNSSVTVL